MKKYTYFPYTYLVLLFSLALVACGQETNNGSSFQHSLTVEDCSTNAKDPLQNAPMTMAAANIVGSSLEVEYQHSGGCRDHQYFACFSYLDDTDRWLVRVHHDDKGDTCEALITGTLDIDLTNLPTMPTEVLEIQSPNIILQ